MDAVSLGLISLLFLFLLIYRLNHRYMRTEALNNKYVYGAPIQGGRLVLDLADMHQKCTQSYVRRPYGVGLLVAVHDQTGPHLYITEPSGDYFEYYATAIGSRSQTSRTYLEKEFETFETAPLEELIKHSLRALSASLASDVELDAASASVGILGLNHPWQVLEGPSLQPFIDQLELEQAQQKSATASTVTPEVGDDTILETPDI
jgi:20S proteasome subunit alpha 6